jgi:thiosulfate/3-mercaptopyruvate sulfurtransferase
MTMGADLMKLDDLKFESTAWAAEHLADDDLIVIDSQADLHDYIIEHLPGAFYFNEKLFRLSSDGIPNSFIAGKAVESHLENIGYTADKKILIYGGTGKATNESSINAPFMTAYSLYRVGVENIYILDGGLNKWRQENRRVEKEYPTASKGSFKAELQQDLLVDMDYVKGVLADQNKTLVDVRAKGAYLAKGGPWERAGHIPGAINILLDEILADANPFKLKPQAEIEALIDRYGLDNKEEIIIYCGTSHNAVVLFLVFKFLLNLDNIRFFEGGYTEWSIDPENPIEKEAN